MSDPSAPPGQNVRTIFFWKETGEEKADLQSDAWFTFSCAPLHQQGAAHINVRNKLNFLKRKSWFYVILPFWMKTKADRRRWCEWTTCSWNFHMRKYFHLKSFSSPSFSSLSKVHKPHYKHQRNKWAPFLFSFHFQFSSYLTFCSLGGRIVMQAVSKAIYWELLWKTWFQLHPTEFSLKVFAEWKNRKRSYQDWTKDAGENTTRMLHENKDKYKHKHNHKYKYKHKHKHKHKHIAIV